MKDLIFDGGVMAGLNCFAHICLVWQLLSVNELDSWPTNDERTLNNMQYGPSFFFLSTLFH